MKLIKTAVSRKDPHVSFQLARRLCRNSGAVRCRLRAARRRSIARTPNGSPAAKVAVEQSTTPPRNDDAWRGLERHEIQLDQKLLVVKGPKGVIGCPYLNVGSFEKFGEACAIIPAVDTAGMLDSKVTAVTTKAKDLGIEVGMSGRDAFDKIR